MKQSTYKAVVYPWVVCLVGALFYSYEYVLRIAPSVMNPELMQHYDADAYILGLIVGCYYWAYVPMQLPVGLMLDRFGPRRLLTLACLMCVFATYLFAATESQWGAGVARFLLGFASAFAFAGVLKLAALWLSEDKLGLVAGLASALGTLGAWFGDNILTYIVQHVGWQQTLNYSAWVGLAITAIIWLVIRDEGVHQDDPRIRKEENFRECVADMRRIMRNPQIWIVGLIGCFIYLPTTVLAEQWGPIYLEQARHFTPQEAGWANSSIFLGFTIGAPVIGMLSDHFKLRRLPLFYGALAASIIASIVFFVPNISPTTMSFLLFALGLTYAAQTLVFVIGRELSPAHAAATAVAAINMFVMLGGYVLQPCVGLILRTMGGGHVVAQGAKVVYSFSDYTVALMLIPIGIFLAAILSMFLKETHAAEPVDVEVPETLLKKN